MTADHDNRLRARVPEGIAGLEAENARLRAVEHRVCEGCGTSRSDAELKAGGWVSCCPERKMLSAKEWRDRAENALDQIRRLELAREALK